MKDIVKRYSFSQDEQKALQNLEIGIISSSAAVNGMQVMKSGLLQSVYKRLGIDGKPQKGYTSDIKYNLGENVIEYRQTPVKENGKKK